MLSIVVAVAVVALFFIMYHYLGDIVVPLIMMSFGLVFIGLNFIEYAWWLIVIGGFFLGMIFFGYFLFNQAHG